MSKLEDLQWTVGGLKRNKKIIPSVCLVVTAAASDSEEVGSAFVRLNLGLSGSHWEI